MVGGASEHVSYEERNRSRPTHHESGGRAEKSNVSGRFMEIASLYGSDPYCYCNTRPTVGFGGKNTSAAMLKNTSAGRARTTVRDQAKARLTAEHVRFVFELSQRRYSSTPKPTDLDWRIPISMTHPAPPPFVFYLPRTCTRPPWCPP